MADSDEKEEAKTTTSAHTATTASPPATKERKEHDAVASGASSSAAPPPTFGAYGVGDGSTKVVVNMACIDAHIAAGGRRMDAEAAQADTTTAGGGGGGPGLPRAASLADLASTVAAFGRRSSVGAGSGDQARPAGEVSRVNVMEAEDTHQQLSEGGDDTPPPRLPAPRGDEDVDSEKSETIRAGKRVVQDQIQQEHSNPPLTPPQQQQPPTTTTTTKHDHVALKASPGDVGAGQDGAVGDDEEGASAYSARAESASQAQTIATRSCRTTSCTTAIDPAAGASRLYTSSAHATTSTVEAAAAGYAPRPPPHTPRGTPPPHLAATTSERGEGKGARPGSSRGAVANNNHVDTARAASELQGGAEDERDDVRRREQKQEGNVEDASALGGTRSLPLSTRPDPAAALAVTTTDTTSPTSGPRDITITVQDTTSDQTRDGNLDRTDAMATAASVGGGAADRAREPIATARDEKKQKGATTAAELVDDNAAAAAAGATVSATDRGPSSTRPPMRQHLLQSTVTTTVDSLW